MRRFLLYSLLSLYACVAIGLSVVRFWVLPNLQHWQAPIQNQLSELVGAELRFAHISGSWRGLRPRIVLDGLEVRDAQHHSPGLHLKRVALEISWRSLLLQQPIFHAVAVDGVGVLVRRDADAQVVVAGIPLNEHSTQQVDHAEPLGLLRWLMLQRQVSFTAMQLTWLDEYRGGTVQQLDDIHLYLRNHQQRHQLQIQRGAQPSVDDFLLSADLHNADGEEANPDTLTGQIYVRAGSAVSTVEDSLRSIWPALAANITQLELWLDLNNGAAGELTINVASGPISFSAAEQESSVQAEQLSLLLQAPWEVVDHALRGDNYSSSAPLLAQLKLKEAQLTASSYLGEVVSLDTLKLRARWQDGALSISELDWRSNDLSLHTQLYWQPSHTDPLGKVWLEGEFSSFALASVARYFPLGVDDEVRDWLQAGLRAGQLQDGRVQWWGEVSHFPYQQQPEHGSFALHATVKDADVDYYPPDQHELGWPAVVNAQGQLHIEGAALRASFEQAQLMISPQQRVSIEQLALEIPDMEENSTLHLQAATTGQAADYLGLFHHSDLGELLAHNFNESTATGTWRVPLQLTVPLLMAENTQVSGRIDFQGGSLQIMPEIPPLQQLQGSLRFSETGVSSSNLRAQWLGQPARASGYLDTQRQAHEAFTIYGSFDSESAASVLPELLQTALRGRTSFELALRLSRDADFFAELHSNLEGLAVDLPAPVTKSRTQRWPLHAVWQPVSAGATDDWLTIELGQLVKAQFLHEPNHTASYFSRGSIVSGNALSLDQPGLQVDVRDEQLDLDAWFVLVDSLQASDSSSPILPPLTRLRVQAKDAVVLGLGLEHLTLTLHEHATQQWRVDISSTQVAGSVQWQEDAQHAIDGTVQAKFHRLHITEHNQSPEREEDDSAPLFEGTLSLPDIHLRVDELKVSDRFIGRLEAEGRADQQQELWHLERIQLDAPGLTLQGQGLWYLSGEQRGLVVNAASDVSDLGAYIQYFGVDNTVSKGQGRIGLHLHWQHLPWHVRLRDIHGDIDVALEKGRLDKVHSRAARLLELLSLQSLGRLASFNASLGGVLNDGFPFDKLDASFSMHDGKLLTSNTRMLSPIGVIAMQGEVGLQQEDLNVQLTVVPSLDMSGASVAAAFMVNPAVGIGAFFTQLFMREPLSKAMTVRYMITGPWEDPIVEEVSKTPTMAPATP